MGGGPERNPTGSTGVVNDFAPPILECERSFTARTSPILAPDSVGRSGPIRLTGESVLLKIGDQDQLLLEDDLPAGLRVCLSRGFEYEGIVIVGPSGELRVNVRSVP